MTSKDESKDYYKPNSHDIKAMLGITLQSEAAQLETIDPMLSLSPVS